MSFDLPTDTTLPPEVSDSSAWYGSELAGRSDWIEQAEIAEVEKAVCDLEESQVDLASLTAQDVSLPTLAPRLHRLLNEVLNGRGFVLIKSLPLDRWPSVRWGLLFSDWVHLGSLRMQNAQGDLLGHVKDLGRSSDDPHTPIYRVNAKLITPIRVTL